MNNIGQKIKIASLLLGVIALAVFFIFYFKNKNLISPDLLGINRRLFEDDLVFYKSMTPDRKDLLDSIKIQRMDDSLFLTGLSNNPGFLRGSGFYGQLYDGVDPAVVKKAWLAFYASNRKNKPDLYRLAIIEYYNDKDIDFELTKIEPKSEDYYFKKDKFLLIITAPNKEQEFREVVKEKNPDFQEIKADFFAKNNIKNYPKEVISGTNLEKIKSKNNQAFYVAKQNGFTISVANDIAEYLKIKSKGFYENKIVFKQKINNNDYYIIENSYCNWDFSKKCQSEEYYLIDNRLNSKPIFYDVSLSILSKTLVKLLQDHNSSSQIVSYFKNKPVDLLKKELEISERGGNVYMSKNFTEEIYRGTVLDGKLFFNYQQVIDDTKTTFLEKIKNCNIFYQPLSSYTCDRYLRLTGNTKLTKELAENYCQPLENEEKNRCLHTAAVKLDSLDLCSKLNEATEENSLNRRKTCSNDVYIYNHYKCDEIKKITVKLKKEQKCNDCNNLPDCSSILACVRQNLENPEICAENEAACHGDCERLYPICNGDSYNKGLIYPEICEKTDCE